VIGRPHAGGGGERGRDETDRSHRGAGVRPLSVRLAYAAPIWLAARIYVGYLWLHAGWEKVTGTTGGVWAWHWSFTGDSWLRSSAGLKGFAAFALGNAQGPNAPVNYGWYAAFLRWLEHGGGWMAPVIAIGETVIGLALLLGLLTAIAAFFGGLLTVAFGLAGIAGVNPIFLVLEMLLVLAWRNAGYIGLDRFVLPAVGTPWEPGPLFRRQQPPTASPSSEERAG
jgi:thiosulfate dehydrogenase (quinone) large subunit